MATLVSKYSLLEQAKKIDPDGRQAKIAEIQTFENEMLFDAPWFPSNDIWTHKTTRRADKPTGSRRQINKGVAVENSQTTEVLDVITMIESYSEPDIEYIDNMEDPQQARFDEAQIFIEGIGQTLGTAMLYDNALTDEAHMTGLSPRLGSIDSQYIFGQGGTGSDLTSIYIVTWGRMFVHMIFPKNTPLMAGNTRIPGVIHKNLGEQTVTDATASRPNTSQYQAYRDHFKLKAGMVFKDPRGAGRLANIESGTETSNTFDEDNLIKITNRMKVNANTRMYANDLIFSQMQIKSKDKNNIHYTDVSDKAGEGLSGSIQMTFNGIPIRKIEREILIDTEDAIS